MAFVLNLKYCFGVIVSSTAFYRRYFSQLSLSCLAPLFVLLIPPSCPAEDIAASAEARASLGTPQVVRPKVLSFSDSLSQPVSQATPKEQSNQSESSIAGYVKAAQAAYLRRVETLKDNLLRLSRVELKGTYRVDKQEMLSYLGLSPTASLFSTVLPNLGARLAQHPWVEKFKIDYRLYPLALEISIEEREPWLIAEYEKHSWLVSTEGHLIQPLDSLKNKELIFETTELPRLDGLDPLVGKDSFLNSANARFNYARQQLRFLQASSLPFSVERYTLLPNGEMRLSPAERNNLEVILLCQDYEEAKLLSARLKSVLADLDSRGEKARRIDLRFKNQVVVD